MTRRDYILNTFANKLAKDPAVEAPAPATEPTPEAPAADAPVSLKDKLLQGYGGAKQLAVANPTTSAAVGGGALTALLAAVMSKKGKRLSHAAVGAGVGAGIGAGAVQGYGPLTERIKAELAKRKTEEV